MLIIYGRYAKHMSPIYNIYFSMLSIDWRCMFVLSINVLIINVGMFMLIIYGRYAKHRSPVYNVYFPIMITDWTGMFVLIISGRCRDSLVLQCVAVCCGVLRCVAVCCVCVCVCICW